LFPESLAVNASILESSKGSLKVSAISPQQGGEASRFKNSFRRKCISISRKFPKSDLNVASPEKEMLPHFAL